MFQVKRRLIVHSIVEIENSYLEALISLLEVTLEQCISYAAIGKLPTCVINKYMK